MKKITLLSLVSLFFLLTYSNSQAVTANKPADKFKNVQRLKNGNFTSAAKFWTGINKSNIQYTFRDTIYYPDDDTLIKI
jgi:hypothetical protein